MGNLIQKNERNRFSTAGAGSARGTGSCRAGSYDDFTIGDCLLEIHYDMMNSLGSPIDDSLLGLNFR